MSTGPLVALLEDPMTVRMFATVPALLDGEVLEEAARAAHKIYLAAKKDIVVDPSMQPWENLGLDLKASNRDQIANALEILRYAGFVVAPWTKTSKTIEFTGAEVQRMAAMEHGRFNVERTRQGWKPSEKKDMALKLSPHLIPWSKLPEHVKAWDYSAVKGWPAILKAIHLEIRRQRTSRKRGPKAAGNAGTI
jgi:hypothetical protein